MKTHLTILGLILLAIPALLWPFIMMANIMSLAALAQANYEPSPSNILMGGFLLLTSTYPLFYLAGAILSIYSLTKKREDHALLWLCLPSIVILPCIILVIFVW